MKAKVDPDACVSCGLCVEICPEVFKLNNDGIAEPIVDEVPTENQTSCREAADSCPAEAISLEE